MNSTHKVEVVPIVLEEHGNADTLSIVRVFGGYTCVVRTADWVGVGLGAYIPPDSLVDTNRPEFAFLTKDANAEGFARIKAQKLRGVVSYGLLVPLPAAWPGRVGDDVTELFGVTHWEPMTKGECAMDGLNLGEANSPAPYLYCPKYDLEAFKRHHIDLTPGELVYVTEKIHGTSARYVCHDGQMYCGSNENWKLEFADYSHITMEYLVNKITQQREQRVARLIQLGQDYASWRDKLVPAEEKAALLYARVQLGQGKKNLWWKSLEFAPIESWCEDHPDMVLYGEVFGLGIQKNYAYGATQDDPLIFAAFDVMVDNRFLDIEPMLRILRDYFEPIPLVPHLFTGDYNFDKIVELSDGPSRWPGAAHNREGCVVRPMQERLGRSGRTVLKCVGATYTMQKQPKEEEEVL